MSRLEPARLALLLGLVLLSLLGGGCSTTHHINVNSDTCWLMTVDGSSDAVTRECGDANFKVLGSGFHCVRVTNLGPTGFVRVRVDGGPWSPVAGTAGEIAERCR